jgi:hypothetical protein
MNLDNLLNSSLLQGSSGNFDTLLDAQNMPRYGGSAHVDASSERLPLLQNPLDISAPVKPRADMPRVKSLNVSGINGNLHGQVTALLQQERKELDKDGAPQSVLNIHEKNVTEVNKLFDLVRKADQAPSSVSNLFNPAGLTNYDAAVIVNRFPDQLRPLYNEIKARIGS